MVGVVETLVIGVAGYGLLRLGFHPAPVLLGYVLGPRFEEDFRRAMVLAHGDVTTFVSSPISATFFGLSVLLVATQAYTALRRLRSPRDTANGASVITRDPIHEE